jgi:hypothetical protein
MTSINSPHSPAPLTAQEKLTMAVRMAQEGKYQEALDIHLWFHHHALEEEPALMGVRLSFAIAYWADLAKLFPPALFELQRILEVKTSQALHQTGDQPESFYEVEAINQYLGTSEKTYQVFKTIEASNPSLATACSHRAMPVLLAHYDYDAADKYIPADASYYATKAQELSQDIAHITISPEHLEVVKDTYISLFLEPLQQLRLTWQHRQKLQLAEELVEIALCSIQPTDLQQRVRDHWVKLLQNQQHTTLIL